MDRNRIHKKNCRLAIILCGVVILMFGFGFSLVPLYEVICKTFGINGKTNTSSIGNKSLIDTSRKITIQFISHTDSKLPWRFYPLTREIKVYPGANTTIFYIAENLSPHSMAAQAIPSVSPGIAANYLRKTECFCFRQHNLASGAIVKMPVLFHIDRDLPKKIKEITLSYTLFKAKQPLKNRTPGRIS